MAKNFNSFDPSAAHQEKAGLPVTRRDLFLGGGAVCTAVVGAAFLGGNWISALPLSPHAHTKASCAADGRAAATTAILIDASDPFDDNHAARIRSSTKEELRRLPAEGKVVVTKLDLERRDNLAEIAVKCSPGLETDSFSRGTIFAERKFNETFETPVLQAVDAAILPRPPTVSPIHETIGALCRRADFDGATSNRRLLIISDGLQNDRMPSDKRRPLKGSYTHYANRDLWKAFQRSPLASRPGPDLSNVQVVFLYIDRPEFAQFQGQQHRDFWNRWLRLNGAASVEFKGAALGVIARKS